MVNMHVPLTTHFKAEPNSSKHNLERLRLSSCYDSKFKFPAKTGSAPENIFVWVTEIHLPITTYNVK